jgi:gentisate 1,2-dioxygenase
MQVPYPTDAGEQPLASPVDNALRRPGDLAPPSTANEQRLVFKWRDAWDALCGMSDSEKSPFDARVIQYRNPRYNGNTLATFNCWLQMLEPGEQTRFHRHTHSHVYYAFQGSGAVELQDREMAWEEGDSFVVPNWTWHRHRSTDGAQPSILFSMNDLPILQYVDLVREETTDGFDAPPKPAN